MKGRFKKTSAIFYAWVLAAALAVPSFGGMKADARTGMLSGFPGHSATGKVTVSKDSAGKAFLDLTGIRVDRVPDGRVHLAKGGDHTKGVELGKLTQFRGDVRYPIPDSVNPDEYDSVVIWCKKFEVGIGKATLGTTGMK